MNYDYDSSNLIDIRAIVLQQEIVQIKKLIKDNPNDADLGRQIRLHFDKT